MSAWSKIPPNHEEWLDGNGNGYWWVKFILCEREADIDEDGNPVFWPEVWTTEVVQITDVITKGLLENGRLTAKGSILKAFYLDDTEATKDLYWQPIIQPLDDVKDQRPMVD